MNFSLNGFCRLVLLITTKKPCHTLKYGMIFDNKAVSGKLSKN